MEFIKSTFLLNLHILELDLVKSGFHDLHCFGLSNLTL